jgi:hypothetical protein
MKTLISIFLFCAVLSTGVYYLTQSIPDAQQSSFTNLPLIEQIMIIGVLFWSLEELFGNMVRKWFSVRYGERLIASSNGLAVKAITFDIDNPLRTFGKKASFNVRLLNAHLKIKTSENIPALSDFIGNPHIEKHVEVVGGRASNNGDNIAYDHNDEPFSVDVELFDCQGSPIPIEPYIVSCFPSDNSGHQLIYNLCNKNDLKHVSRIKVTSSSALEFELIVSPN